MGQSGSKLLEMHFFSRRFTASSSSYQFAIKRMFFDHDRVDGFGVFKCEEAEAARPACGAIAHDGAFYNLTKLREVIFQ